MLNWRKETTLKSLCVDAKEKINVEDLNDETYISTENMIVNRGGITKATSLPTISKVSKIYPWDVLFSNIRTYFKKLHLSDFIWWCSNDVLIFRPNENVDSKFLFYSLSQESFFDYTIKTSKWTKMPRWDKKAIDNYIINLPPINEQRRIAGVLSSLDDKIKLNNQINHNLYDIWDKLYNEYYKDLKPWYKIVSLKEVSNNFDSKRKPMSSREREKHKWIYPYYWATSIIDYVDDYIFDWIYLLIWEDWTVMTDEWTPVLQYIWWKNRINNHAHVLQWSNISTEHLFFALRTINIKSLITWAVQLKLNQENMNKISFILWTDEINSKFEEKISVIMKKIKNNLVENEKLANIRDTLLPKLMNWEINLDNVTI